MLFWRGKRYARQELREEGGLLAGRTLRWQLQECTFLSVTGKCSMRVVISMALCDFAYHQEGTVHFDELDYCEGRRMRRMMRLMSL